jgi:Tol biopolymer transport system component
MAISPDGKEIYFCVNLGEFTFSTILVTRLRDGAWSEPEVMAHMEDPRCWNIEPCISSDGKRFFFMSNRPDPATGESKGDEDIWVMERVGDGWGEPRNLGLPVSSDHLEFFPSLTRDGTLYFARRDKASGEEAIFRSRLHDGKYQEPEKLPPQVNSGQTRFNAFVAPDESYIIVPTYGRKDSLGSTDYYVSFRNPDDSWTEAVNMGERINTAGGGEYSPSISPDGKYLFFMSSRVLPETAWPEKLTAAFLHGLHAKLGNGNSSIYWVDARVIESLRPKKSQ